MEIFADGFEAIISGAATFCAVAQGAEIEVEIVAEDEEVGWGEFVEM